VKRHITYSPDLVKRYLVYNPEQDCARLEDSALTFNAEQAVDCVIGLRLRGTDDYGVYELVPIKEYLSSNYYYVGKV